MRAQREYYEANGCVDAWHDGYDSGHRNGYEQGHRAGSQRDWVGDVMGIYLITFLVVAAAVLLWDYVWVPLRGLWL